MSGALLGGGTALQARWIGSLGICLLLTGCWGESTRPAPCYTSISELYRSGSSVDDSVAAKAVFGAYLDHLRNTNGYPVDRWYEIRYLRCWGVERYHGAVFRHITALGRLYNGGWEDTSRFSVRNDGTVVSMFNGT